MANDFITLLFAVTLAAYGVLVVVYLTLVWRFFSFLKLSHPEIYSNLGSPHLIFNNTPGHTWLLLRFLFKREYQSVNEQGVIKLSTTLRWLLIVGFAMFGSCLFMFFWLATHTYGT